LSSLQKLFNNAPLLITISSVLIALGQFCFKIAARNIDPAQPQSLIFNPAIWLGIAIYIASFPLMLHSYKLWSLSKAFPLVSLSLVWSALLAVVFLSEVITAYRLLGAILIMVGAAIIGSER
jgi:drug/metabolite transporter (DMT)-like permease